MTSLSESELRDKVLGCWMGKNCGGTLGGPLEKVFSEEAPLDVWFYTQVREGGIPNDDLEIQLIWLRALEELGLDLTADDLAEYWLDHVAYCFDEYGLMMTNLRLGLRAPVAGFYNNYFKDCMGCPIRTEIWACLAPGRPRIAARYALIDSIVDHAGGESLYGSLFNVAVEAAAFVIKDTAKLIQIGLSYLPPASLTARCIRAVVESHRAGDDWLTARKKVLEIGRHPIAQYSPPNIAFQVVGWLYGAEFGDAICKAVNCGYDTDCTGATLGSILGIIDGARALPEKWTRPLGDAIATSDPNGVKNLYVPPHPAPRTLEELTDRILRLERLVTARYGPPGDEASLWADEETLRLITEPPTRISTRLGPRLRLDLDYLTTPQIGAEKTTQVEVTLRHDFPEPAEVDVVATPPPGWQVEPAQSSLLLKPGSSWTGRVSVRAPKRGVLENSTPVLFQVRPKGRSVPPAVPLVFVGAPVWLSSANFGEAGQSSAALLDQVFTPETMLGQQVRGEGWKIAEAEGNDVTACVGDFTHGVVYLRGFLHSATSRPVCLHVNSTVPFKTWVGGEVVLESKSSRPLRPNHSGNAETSPPADVVLREGWNEVMIKLATDATMPPFACHVLLSDRARHFAGLVDVRWTRFPWD